MGVMFGEIKHLCLSLFMVFVGRGMLFPLVRFLQPFQMHFIYALYILSNPYHRFLPLYIHDQL